MSEIYNDLFATFSDSLEAFIREVKSKKSSLMATDEWTVKEELCHIVFWHENYAAIYKALAEYKDPPLPEGMSTINMAGVLLLRKHSIKELISRLHKANKSLYDSIVVKKVPRMTYSKGGRTYETVDFLEMIARHINTHAKQVRKAK
ncbi:MAG TPA: DinB family protein [Spirochaetia bacterium]|nr:DinB family protein [Spirochaetia bacterium]